MTTISTDSLAELRDRVRGGVFAPGDPDYPQACSAWNLSVRQQPAIITTPANTLEVAESVRFARAHGLGVAVQATGHGLARPANNALLILTHKLAGITIAPHSQTAHIEAGVRWGHVLEQAQAYGLAPLLGSSPNVGAVGYTLGGGAGWLARKHGLAVDSVQSFDVVTAQGHALRVSAAEHPDLFWALRGGGGANYAIVTAMDVRLYPVSMVYGGNLLYPLEQAREVFQRYREWITELPDEMTTSVLIMNYPPFPQVPEPVRGKSFAIVRGCYAGDLEAGKALVDSWRAWRPPVLDAFGPLPFGAVASISQDPADPIPGYSSGTFLSELSDEAIDAILAASIPQGGPPPVIKLEVHQMGGTIARAAREEAAASHREQPLLLHLVAVTPTPEASQAAERHADALWQALAPFIPGPTYPNFLDGVDQVKRVRDMYEVDKLARLRAVKAAYDPDNRLSYGYGAPGM